MGAPWGLSCMMIVQVLGHAGRMHHDSAVVPGEQSDFRS
jgi:hypothetical protein